MRIEGFSRNALYFVRKGTDHRLDKLYAGTPGGFVIAVANGPTLYPIGDSDVFSDMTLIGSLNNIDIMLTCIGGHFTMGPKRAALAARLVNPGLVIPMRALPAGNLPLQEPRHSLAAHQIRELSTESGCHRPLFDGIRAACVNHGDHPCGFYFSPKESRASMISANNVALAYGKRVIFKDVNIKFIPGNCYGLIGANGVGKSTFLKILAGELEADKGEISVGPGERIAMLRQDHFAFDEQSVFNTVMMGHQQLYRVMAEREAIYSKGEFTEEDGRGIFLPKHRTISDSRPALLPALWSASPLASWRQGTGK